MHHEFDDIQVIKDVCSVNDIYQGDLGDCYLLSALSAIAEFPERVERLFVQRKRSPKGAYCVALCITGTFREIYIDDIVLCTKNKISKKKEVRLAFAQNNQGKFEN